MGNQEELLLLLLIELKKETEKKLESVYEEFLSARDSGERVIKEPITIETQTELSDYRYAFERLAAYPTILEAKQFIKNSLVIQKIIIERSVDVDFENKNLFAALSLILD